MSAPAPAPEAATVARARPGHVFATGSTTFDAKRTAHVYTPVRGFVVKIHARRKTVRRGEALATLYSPDLLLAEQALLAERAAFRSQAHLDAARRQLKLWGISWPEISRIEQTGKPRGMLTLRAQVAGTIVSPPVVGGLYVDASTELFTVTDPSRLWVLVDLPPGAADRVRAGTPASLQIGNAKPIRSPVAYVYSSGIARFELANTELVPDIAATAELDLGKPR